MEKIVRQGQLYDFYGELLTEHQKKIYEDVVFNDLSLSEIAAERGISRQGVYDLIDKVNDDPSDANIQEFEQYLRDNAAIMGLYGNSVINVAQDGVTEFGYNGMLEPAACVYADDYVSAGD